MIEQLQLVSLVHVLTQKGILDDEDVGRVRSVSALENVLRGKRIVSSRDLKRGDKFTRRVTRAFVKASELHEQANAKHALNYLKDRLGDMLPEEEIERISEMIRSQQ